MVDTESPVVDFATRIPLYRAAAMEYIGLRNLLNLSEPSLEEAIQEMIIRFPNKEAIERYCCSLLHKETKKRPEDFRLGKVLPFRR